MRRAIIGFVAVLLAAPAASAEPTQVSKKKLEANTETPRWSHDGGKMSYEFHSPKKDERGVTIVKDWKAPKASSYMDIEPDTGPEAGGDWDEGKKPTVRELAWHPTGRAYVYGSTGGRSQINLYMEGEGCLTCDKAFGYGNKIHPTWSPDGKLLAYAKEANEQGDVYVVDIYNLEKGPTQLTESDDETSYQPRFSPDSKALLFTRFNPEKSDNDLFVIDDVTKHRKDHRPRRLSSLTGAELNAAWSPDGKQVAFFNVYKKKDDTLADLYVVGADGKAPPKKLMADVVKPDRSNPVWTPDGKRVIFVKRKDHKTDKDPLMWVSVENPKENGVIKTATQLNGDPALFGTGGELRLCWKAQGRVADKKKRWRKVYCDTITIP